MEHPIIIQKSEGTPSVELTCFDTELLADEIRGGGSQDRLRINQWNKSGITSILPKKKNKKKRNILLKQF